MKKLLKKKRKKKCSTETPFDWTATGKAMKVPFSPDMKQKPSPRFLCVKDKKKLTIGKKSMLVRVSEGHSEASPDSPRFSF